MQKDNIIELYFSGYTQHLKDGALRLQQNMGDIIIEILVCPNPTNDGFTMQKIANNNLSDLYSLEYGGLECHTSQDTKSPRYLRSVAEKENILHQIFYDTDNSIYSFTLEEANNRKKQHSKSDYVDSTYWSNEFYKETGNFKHPMQLLLSSENNPVTNNRISAHITTATVMLRLAQSLYKTLKQKSHRSKAT